MTTKSRPCITGWIHSPTEMMFRQRLALAARCATCLHTSHADNQGAMTDTRNVFREQATLRRQTRPVY